MAEEQLKIEVPGRGMVTTIRTPPEGQAVRCTFVYAPGAGSTMHDPFGVYACRELAARGFESVRLQFPYMEARKRSPDRPPVLEATWRAVLAAVRRRGHKLVVGGRSMGGRIASQVVAQGEPVNALALFAYPLHAPVKPTVWRDEHLPTIDVPSLFCSGTRDAFAGPDELRRLVKRLPSATLHLLDGADHGFAVPKASGRTRQDVWVNALEALVAWLRNEEIAKARTR